MNSNKGQEGYAVLLFPNNTKVTFEGNSEVIRQLIARLDKYEVEYTQTIDPVIKPPFKVGDTL